MGTPLAVPDIPREDVAKAAGETIADLATRGDRGLAVETMAAGAAKIAIDLFQRGRLHGVLGLGGFGRLGEGRVWGKRGSLWLPDHYKKKKLRNVYFSVLEIY